MKRRYLLAGLICIFALMICVVSACGGGGNSTTTSSTTSSTTQTTSTTTSTQTATSTTTTSSVNSDLEDILGKVANITSVKYDMVMTVPGIGTMEIKMWQKLPNMKEDMTVQGVHTILFMDMEENVMYTYMPDQNMAVKTTLDASAVPEGGTDSVESMMDYNPTVVGTESIDGKSCTVVTYEMPGAGDFKMWIWKDKGFPLKTEIVLNGETTTVECKNVDFSDIPDSTFDLPTGVTFVEM